MTKELTTDVEAIYVGINRIATGVASGFSTSSSFVVPLGDPLQRPFLYRMGENFVQSIPIPDNNSNNFVDLVITFTDSNGNMLTNVPEHTIGLQIETDKPNMR